MNEQPEDFGGSFLERPSEPIDEVVTRRPVIETVGLQPEDLGVLLALLLLPEGWTGTAKDTAAMLRKQYGWKMSDERFATISKRLRSVGHMGRQSVFNEKTRRPEWRLRIYRNPANNPEYVTRGAEEASQVSDENRENRFSGQGENREKRVSPGQSRNPGNPVFGAETAKSGFPSGDVPAGQSRNPGNPVFGTPPPLPPGGGKTSSPYPLTEGARPYPTEEEEGVSYETEELDAAADVLEGLPDPWIVGEKDAADMAPLLLASMSAKDWPSILTVDRKALVACLAINPGGMNNPVNILRTRRIPNLPKYSRVAARIAKNAVRPVEGLPVVECTAGCDQGWFFTDAGVKPCDCLRNREHSGT